MNHQHPGVRTRIEQPPPSIFVEFEYKKYPVIIAFAIKKVAILFFYDAGVQTTLGDYDVLDASSGVLPERIVITLYFAVLKAGFMTSRSERFVLLPLKSNES